MPGYHIKEIPQGVFGNPSKIKEEVEEFFDAVDQGNPVMALTELSDLLGAIEGWLVKNHPSVTLNDILKMKDATDRAFAHGVRRPR